MKLTLLLVPIFVALCAFAAPTPTYAASATFFGPIVPEECHCEDRANPDPTGAPITTAPDFGCALQTLQNVVNFAVSISVILFVIYLTIGGFRLVISGGNSEALSQAKTRLLNVVVGVAVLLCSWLIVDFVMKTLYDKAKFGPWNAILAGAPSGGDRCLVAKTPSSIATGQVGIAVENTGTTGTGGDATGGGVSGSGGYTGTGFTYQANVRQQVPQESTALSTFLGCMATKLPKGVGNISSISENAIASGQKTMQQCAARGCAHTANSCHYGGSGSCNGYSYAVDFGDEGNAAALRAAAKACNPNAKYNYEGDHVHISIGTVSGCSCDAGMGSI